MKLSEFRKQRAQLVEKYNAIERDYNNGSLTTLQYNLLKGRLLKGNSLEQYLAYYDRKISEVVGDSGGEDEVSRISWPMLRVGVVAVVLVLAMIFAFMQPGMTGHVTSYLPVNSTGFAGETYNWTVYNGTALRLYGAMHDNLSEFVNTTGVVAIWHLDDSTEDNSGNGRNGTVYGANVTNDGHLESAYVFDGVDDYINFSNTDALNMPGGMTISVWIKYNGYTLYPTIISKGSQNYRLFVNPTGTVTFRVIVNGTNSLNLVVTNESLQEHVWYHLVGTYDGQFIRLYMDGVLQDSEEMPGSITNSTSPFIIGDIPGFSRPFNGSIDEVYLWNRSLSAQEVADLYYAQNGEFVESGSYTSPVFDLDVVREWDVITWQSDIVPAGSYGETLPDNGTFALGINMSGNVLLLHLEGDLFDASGLGHDGSGEAVFTTDAKAGTYAARFSGSNRTLSYQHNESIANLSALTIESWVRLNESTNVQLVVDKLKSMGSAGYAFGVNPDATLKVYLGNGTILYNEDSNVSITWGEWHHIAMTYDGDAVVVYIDGRAYQMPRYSGRLKSYDRPLQISSSWFVMPINGTVDEVAIYNRSLDAGEVLARYRLGVMTLNLSVRHCESYSCVERGLEWDVECDNTPCDISMLNASRYIQYRVVLKSADHSYTPMLYNVSVIHTEKYPRTNEFSIGMGTTNFTFVNNLSSVENLTLANADGSILFNGTCDVSGKDFDKYVEIGHNMISVNVSGLGVDYNRSAQLRLEGLTFALPRILRDGVSCYDDECVIVSYSNGTLVFNVSHFSTYTAGESANLTVWDDTDTVQRNNNDQIAVYANYTLANYTGINETNGNCSVNGTLMNYSSETHLWVGEMSFEVPGVHALNVTCDGPEYLSVTEDSEVWFVPGLVSPEAGNDSLIERNVNLTWSGYGGYEYDVLVTRLRCNDPNYCLMPLVNVTANRTYYVTPQLDVDALYNWSVRARLGNETGAWATMRNFTVVPMVGIDLIKSDVNFGMVNIAHTYESTDYFEIENDGNVFENVLLRANNSVFVTEGLNTSYFTYAVDSSMLNFNASASAVDYAPVSSDYGLAVSRLNYTAGSNIAHIKMKLEVPSDEPPGWRSTKIFVRAEQWP